MADLVTCKNEEDSLENEDTRVAQRFSHYKCMGIFLNTQGQLTPSSDTAQFQTHTRFYGCPCYLLKKEEPIKNEGARVVTRFYPL